MGKAHREGGKTGRFLGSGWKETRRGLFFLERGEEDEGEKDKKISQPAPELPIGGFFSFIADSRRIYS